MSDTTTREKMRKLIAEQIGIPRDTVEDGLSFVADLGFDSLDNIEMLMAVEDAFELEIPDDEAEKLSTVGEAIAYVERRLEQA